MSTSSATLFEAQATIHACSRGPWSFDALPGTWSLEDLQLPRDRWLALLDDRGINGVPSAAPRELMELRRRVQKRRRTRPAATGAAVSAAVSAGTLAAASAVAKRARAGPWQVHDGRRDLGLWSLADLQCDPKAWRQLLADRHITGGTPVELRKLRRKMLGRVYARTHDERASDAACSMLDAAIDQLRQLECLTPDLGRTECIEPDVLDSIFQIDGIDANAVSTCVDDSGADCNVGGLSSPAMDETVGIDLGRTPGDVTWLDELFPQF